MLLSTQILVPEREEPWLCIITSEEPLFSELYIAEMLLK